MKKITLVPLVVSVLLLLSVASHAAAPSKLRLQGDSVNATFYSYDPLTCVATGLTVYAYETVQHSTGAPDAARSLYIDLYSYNDCDGTTLVAANGAAEITRAEFEVQGSAQSARLQKSLALQDYFTGATIPVTVDLTWTGIGEPTRSTSHQSLHADYASFSSHATGVSRQADVAGSVTAGSINFPLPAPYWAMISHSNGGTVTHN
jgi:hypothetical protein